MVWAAAMRTVFIRCSGYSGRGDLYPPYEPDHHPACGGEEIVKPLISSGAVLLGPRASISMEVRFLLDRIACLSSILTASGIIWNLKLLRPFAERKDLEEEPHEQSS
jgi:hypothetical protein